MAMKNTTNDRSKPEVGMNFVYLYNYGQLAASDANGVQFEQSSKEGGCKDAA